MYNTRRGGGFGRGSVNNVGQRRPATNFVSAGQLKQNLNQRMTPQPNQKAQQRIMQNQENTTAPPQQNQQPQPVKQVSPQPVAPTTPVSATPGPQGSNDQKSQDVKVTISGDIPKENTTTQENTGNGDIAEGENSTTPSKPKWMKKGVKVSRGERIKRLNKRLKKVLLPKNALMVLNEMIGNTTYELSETCSGIGFPNTQVGLNFKATITIDGKAHEGIGKNKTSAKAAAAEAALHHLVVSKMTKDFGKAESAMDTTDGETSDEKMETEEDFSICHLASFALYKLFNSWEEGGKILSRSSSCTSLTGSMLETSKPGKIELKPSKKLPDNPHLMNPVMLLNQMCPNAVYEEVCKTGTPPNVVFTMKCTIGDKKFIGNGPNKKSSRREAAYYACKELLGIVYPEIPDPPQ